MVEFNTSAFVRSHGKQPKGTGSWGFFFSRDDQRDVMKAWFTPGNTTYAAAKRMAKEEVKRRFGADHGDGEVYVAP